LFHYELQLQLSVSSESYDDFALFFKEKKEKSQMHLERIGKAQGIPNVKYVIYSKGKTPPPKVDDAVTMDKNRTNDVPKCYVTEIEDQAQYDLAFNLP
jgi:hypothetical protein